MEKVYEDSRGYAIVEDSTEGAKRPFLVVFTGGCTGMGQTIKTARTYWQALTLLLELSGSCETLEEALDEAARRERSAEAFSKAMKADEERVFGVITTLKALAPGNDTEVLHEHLGGGIWAVGVYPQGTNAYCWITDMDGFIMMGFYESPEDEVGVMVTPLGEQQFTMDTNEGVKAIADTMRTFYKFFKPSA